MNGCIPLFENLKNCPEHTMTTYPKHLNDEAYELYNNWQETDENIENYNTLCLKYLEHTRKYCTTSHAAKVVLGNVPNHENVKNILLITGHSGVNYNREFLCIGLKRYIQSIGGVVKEFPKIEVLYKDYDIDSSSGPVFTYSRRLESEDSMQEEEIIDKINSKFWDLIIYGKVGPDEYFDFKFFDSIKNKYNKNEIAFIFGGDEPFNLKITDHHAHHLNFFNYWISYWPYINELNYYKELGICFVRELDM
jgi:hypothetical protein